MKNTILSILFLSILALAACAAPIAPAPTPTPVEAPAAELPTAEAPDVPAPVPPPTDELVMLRANPWQWVSFTSPTETFEVETPASYTVTFNSDASLAIVADCNNAAGSYQGEGGKLTIEIGPMTAAACPPDSRSDQFVKLLGNGALYFFQDGNLHIDLAADGGTLVFAPATATATAFGDAWESVSCDTFGVAPEVAALADCGYVTVPENRAAGTENTIRLAVVRVKSVSDTPGAPLLLGTGGPGGPGLQDVQGAQGPAFLAANGPILEDRDFVLFSQRGTALAEPMLDCPAYSALTIQASMEGMSLEARGQAGRDALVKCAEAFAAEGVDLSAYNSNENADDVDAIRQALGYDKIFYYGESYGTQLGQFVLRRHPDILEGIMLDGIVPVTKEQSVRVSDLPGAFQTVFAACAADEACNAAYPDLEAMLVETMDRLRENPVSYTLALPGQEPVEVKVDDLLAMNALFIDLYLPGGYAKLPELVRQLHEGNMAPMRATLPLLLETSSFARVMHYAINCTDDPTTSLDDLALDGVAEVYARLVTDDGQSYANICPALDLPQLPADSDALVESDIPALLLQGGLDPATPRSGGLNVAEGLPNSTEVLVPGGTHVQFGNPCVVNIVRDFMNDPAAKPDLSCIDPTVAFKLPAPVTYVGPGASNAISITLPPTFMTAAPGQWSDNEMVVITASFPATKTVEAVLGETAAALQLQNPEVVAGPTIAGMESAFVQAPPYDIYVFGDEQGAYRVVFDVLNANSADFLRTKVFPAMLESVTVGPAPAAAAPEATTTMEASNTPRLRELDFSPFEEELAAFTPERRGRDRYDRQRR
ncbi:MAG: alpha/beta fold hydrolase [Chitinophagaceae bacterium]